MGILQGKNNASNSSLRFDPFEGLDDAVTDKNLFADLSVIPDRPLRKTGLSANSDRSEVANQRRGKRLALAALLLAISGFTVARFKPWTYFSSYEIVYAYFEVRALDASGRPIAGAVVKNGGKRVGTTDSFGEWRRYMKVPLGATVPLTIAKKSPNHLLYATKNFAVPPEKPEKSDIELRGSVQLQVVDSNDANARNAVTVTPGEMVRSKAAADKESTSNDTMTLTSVDKSSSEEAVSSSGAPAANAKEKVIGQQDYSKFASTHDSIWFELNGSQMSALNREVLPALRKRAADLGLRVDPNAKWKVRLTSLIEKPDRVEKDGGGLLLVSSFDGEKNGASREFLRAYSPEALQTAKTILFSLAHHVNKNVFVQRMGDRWVAALSKSSPDLWKLTAGQELAGDGANFVLSGETFSTDQLSGFYLTKTENDPCLKSYSGCELRTRSFGELPPMPAWKKMRLKVGSLGKDPVKIFVSGYESQQVGDRLYEYWGQDKARVNVTIVQTGRVVYRGQIVNDKTGPVTLGIANISKR